MMWTVQMMLDTDAGPDLLDEIEDALAAQEASVSRVPGDGLLVIAHQWGEVMLEAARAVESAVLAVVGDVEVLSLEVMSEATHEARAERPTLPRVLSAPEVAELLAVSRQRVHQLRSQAAFPAPLYELRTGPIWAADAIEWFARDWDRKPGRRAAS